jgi:undecaprenyl diphosphate synthase
MDGNGRWARERGLSRMDGHRAGAEAVRRTLRAAAERGIEVLTLYAFSSENWSRPRSEVRGLFRMLAEFLDRETATLVEKGIRLRSIGRAERLPRPAREALRRAEAAAAGGDRMTLCLALSYAAQDEIVDAARALAREAVSGEIRPEAIDRAAVERRLHTVGLPPVDLLVRTGGEMRVSNFLLWQISYAELYFSRVWWPEFGGAHLARALEAFDRRERRFGGL